MKECKCCGKYVKSLPILEYSNVPSRAQYFPTVNELNSETGIDLRIYQCENCGLIQHFCTPVSYYRDVIRAVSVSSEMRCFRKSFFKEFVSEYDLFGKKIVEIGAGVGEYLEMFRETGIDICGIENSIESVNEGTRRGLDIYQGFISDEESIIPNGPYDAFLCFNYLEHLPNPSAFLRGIAANLSDDGIGLIEVPNSSRIFDEGLFEEFILDHVSYFSEKTLTLLLESNGFEVLDFRAVFDNNNYSVVIRKRKRVEIDRLICNQDVKIQQISSFVTNMKKHNKKLAVWGAGHHALTLISLAKLSKEVEYIFDSAVFKQDHFSPASHIPIVSPNRIGELNIGAIILMLGPYTKEVRRKLEIEYPQIELFEA